MSTTDHRLPLSELARPCDPCAEAYKHVPGVSGYAPAVYRGTLAKNVPGYWAGSEVVVCEECWPLCTEATA